MINGFSIFFCKKFTANNNIELWLFSQDSLFTLLTLSDPPKSSNSESQTIQKSTPGSMSSIPLILAQIHFVHLPGEQKSILENREELFQCDTTTNADRFHNTFSATIYPHTKKSAKKVLARNTIVRVEIIILSKYFVDRF